MPGIVPVTGRLDLDDIGTEVGQHQRGEGAGEGLGEVDDPDAGEQVEAVGHVFGVAGCFAPSPATPGVPCPCECPWE